MRKWLNGHGNRQQKKMLFWESLAMFRWIINVSRMQLICSYLEKWLSVLLYLFLCMSNQRGSVLISFCRWSEDFYLQAVNLHFPVTFKDITLFWFANIYSSIKSLFWNKEYFIFFQAIMSELISLNVSVVNILRNSQRQIVSVPACTYVTLHREKGTLLFY